MIIGMASAIITLLCIISTTPQWTFLGAAIFKARRWQKSSTAGRLFLSTVIIIIYSNQLLLLLLVVLAS